MILVEGAFKSFFFDDRNEKAPFPQSRRLLRVAITRAPQTGLRHRQTYELDAALRFLIRRAGNCANASARRRRLACCGAAVYPANQYCNAPVMRKEQASSSVVTPSFRNVQQLFLTLPRRRKKRSTRPQH